MRRLESCESCLVGAVLGAEVMMGLCGWRSCAVWRVARVVSRGGASVASRGAWRVLLSALSTFAHFPADCSPFPSLLSALSRIVFATAESVVREAFFGSIEESKCVAGSSVVDLVRSARERSTQAISQRHSRYGFFAHVFRVCLLCCCGEMRVTSV